MFVLRVRAVEIFIVLMMAAIVWTGCESHDTPRKRPGTPLLEAAGPPCQYVDWVPYHNERTTCVEVVYDHVTSPEAAPELMGLAFDPDGTLYLAKTALGEIWAMRDMNNDNFLDDPYQVSAGLRLPIALTFYDEALYVLTVDSVIRLDRTDDDRFDEQTVLVNGLSGNTGFWPGSLGIGPDGRLYVSLGANCVTCDTVDDIRPGMLISYALDGSDKRIEVTGLHNPKDFAWQPETGELWIVDTGQVMTKPVEKGPPDELNRVVTGADYGFPYCYGNQVPDPSMSPPQVDYCTHTQSPRFSFAYQSTPSGIAFYPFNGGFPFWQNDLIVVLSGSWSLPAPAGYAVVVVEFENDLPSGNLSRIVPDSRPISVYFLYELSRYSLLDMGIFPYHPIDVVVDAQGWIYVSLQEGRILRFRPRPKT